MDRIEPNLNESTLCSLRSLRLKIPLSPSAISAAAQAARLIPGCQLAATGSRRTETHTEADQAKGTSKRSR
jgi:hypothetical protein